MTRQSKAIRINAKFAQKTWGKLPQIALRGLEELTSNHSLSVASGDLLYLDGKWYVTHSGLLRLARRSRCAGIRVEPVQAFCDPQAGRGRSGPPSTRAATARDSLAMAMPIRPTHLLWFTALKCELPRPEPSTGLSEKP